ncbi:tRNA threonylcarbamoyladenosine biosynthesis protein TsaB [Flavobacterium croceum DSM 17960]|uniref:tRNA threonylcarbamoyladenosine biosynthesis protein TsaB n=1 Tax=Flavobacterium croceum DSM 17960 TaxID=1121886 RepID=A0A2S4N5J2_9FLAO|nr:tRNA (adenosine(37)-N6)-threonylcarbamoyltransferase complex dimerization subunit type 1 TsaB [Flavobacterium croceum]POS00999.1 tRNA threonylcarbamoyladenosine biosynthesis protein TsaB [Flavobacterium croceum DSM 17960]
MYILHIETATKNCSVAVSKYSEVLCCKEFADAGYAHAEMLHVFIEEALQEAQITPNDLSAIAFGSGPGSYTGLRIGVSAAKGLCYALHIPLIAVDTLEILAQQVKNISSGFIIPMIDARRMEVYSAVFDSNKTKIRETQAEILSENSFENIEDKIYCIGDSNEKAKAVLTQEKFVFLDQFVYPSAKDMVALAYLKFENKQWEDVAYYEPFYLKDFIALKSSK